MRFRVLAIAIILLGFAAPALAQTTTRVEIPIHATPSSRGAPRYSIPVTLGSVQLEAMLDTGSSGLRVLSRALPTSAYQATQRASAYGYGSGAQLEGVIASAPLAIGALSGAAPFELVQSVGCTDRRPDCPMQHMDFSTYGIGGNGVPDEGFTAIIGTGLRATGDGALNPLPDLGANTWIVELPRQDEREGRLILNPNAEDLAGFTLFQLQRQGAFGWADNTLPACLADDATHASICLPAMLDSGAPGVNIQKARGRPRDWPANSAAAITFRHQGGDLTLRFQVNNRLGGHVGTREPNGAPERLFLGTLPYFTFAVFYDAAHGVIGLKPRA